MNTTRNFVLHSTLGRRLLLLFLLSALLPAAVLSALSYTQVGSALRQARDAELAQAVRAYVVTLVDRLNRLDAALAEAAAAEATAGLDALQAGLAPRIGKELEGAARLADDGRVYAAAGVMPALSPLTEAQRQSLAAGRAVLLRAGEDGDSIVLVRRGPTAFSASTLYAIALAPAYLWGDRATQPLMTEFCVIDSARRPLQCPRPLSADTLAELAPVLDTDRSFTAAWQGDDDAFRSHARRLSMPVAVDGAPWLVIGSQAQSYALAPVRSFVWLFFPIVALATLLAAVVGALQIRRILHPLDHLLEGTQRIAQRDFSREIPVEGRDEFGQLARAFNEMTARLSVQFGALRALSQIDRAIMKDSDLAEVARSSLRSIRRVTGAEIVSLWLREPDAPQALRVYNVRGDENTRAERGDLDGSAEVDAAMERAPVDAWTDIAVLPAEYLTLLKPGRMRRCYLQPIKRDDRLSGMIVLVNTQPQPLSPEQQSLLRSVADRLAVALTGAERDHKLRQMAHLDALTGLPNRHSLLTLLARELAHARRDNTRVGVLFMDLDRFKQTNDTLGHAAGDMLLKQAAQRIRENLRETDTVGRHGGDEFTVVLSNLASPRDAGGVARTLIKALSQAFEIEGNTVYVGASVGIALFPEDGNDGADLLKKADTAMYRAKEQGRNRFAYYTDRMNAEVTRRATLDRELRRAFERGEFVLHYQPQIDLRTGQVCAAEALVRWQHPERGLLAPGAFIPFAEESGLIDAIGTWVLREACLQHAKWRRDGVPFERISVNVSNRQLRQKRFLQLIDYTLVATKMPPACLEIEVTESLFLDGGKAAIDALHALQDAGVRVAIDDFGTGYSSFGYLKTLPASVLKLDRSFVVDVGNDRDSAAIAGAIIKMAHMLRKEVVAEGVETQAQVEFLRELGCEKVQGYFFSRPLPADDAALFALQRMHPITAGRSAVDDAESTAA